MTNVTKYTYVNIVTYVIVVTFLTILIFVTNVKIRQLGPKYHFTDGIKSILARKFKYNRTILKIFKQCALSLSSLTASQNRRRRKACGQMNIQVVLCLNLINIGHLALLLSSKAAGALRRTKARGQLTTHNATKRQKQ